MAYVTYIAFIAVIVVCVLTYFIIDFNKAEPNSITTDNIQRAPAETPAGAQPSNIYLDPGKKICLNKFCLDYAALEKLESYKDIIYNNTGVNLSGTNPKFKLYSSNTTPEVNFDIYGRSQTRNSVSVKNTDDLISSELPFLKWNIQTVRGAL